MINCLNDWVVIDWFILDQYLIDDRYLIADRYLIDLWSIYLFMINWLIFDRLIFDWFSKDWFMFDWLIFVIFDWLIYLVNGPIILLHFVSQLRTSADWEAGIPLPLNKVHGLIWSYSKRLLEEHEHLVVQTFRDLLFIGNGFYRYTFVHSLSESVVMGFSACVTSPEFDRIMSL